MRNNEVRVGRGGRKKTQGGISKVKEAKKPTGEKEQEGESNQGSGAKMGGGEMACSPVSCRERRAPAPVAGAAGSQQRQDRQHLWTTQREVLGNLDKQGQPKPDDEGSRENRRNVFSVETTEI